MRARLRSWWQKIIEHPYATGIVVLSVFVFILFIFLAYRFGWDWTGFNSGTNQITITNTSKTNYSASVSQPSKSLWDWLQLLGILAIPVVVGLGAAWFTAQQGKVSERENKDNQHEKALQDYIDKMSELLLEKNLRGSAKDDEVRFIARSRTLTVIRGLDADRKGSLIKFLAESYLINSHTAEPEFFGLKTPKKVPINIIRLADADLSGINLRRSILLGIDLTKTNLCKANLREANLSIPPPLTFLIGSKGSILDNADLSGANLRNANLSNVSLEKANLSHSDLSDVDLTGANLKGAIGITIEELEKQAKSLKGATMPDGSIHP